MVVAVLTATTWMTGSIAGCGIGLDGENLTTPGIADSAPTIDAGMLNDAPLYAKPPTVEASDTGSLTASVGSPLCGLKPSVEGTGAVACNPDQGTCVPTPIADPPDAQSLDAGEPGEFDASAAADASISPTFDAGIYPPFDAGGETAVDARPSTPTVFACHVTPVHTEAGATSSVPICSAAGKGQNQAVCTVSSDCAAGFECVIDDARVQTDGALTVGVCRRYCCDNTCAEANSYCDIETTVSGSVAVPVCVTRPAASAPDGGSACQLLDDTSCTTSELSCQVVSAGGEVACVTPGIATAGESCEVTKCANGLSCVLGYFPSRTCAQLCKLESDTCPAGQKCMQNSTVSTANPTIGVCGS